MTNLSIVIPAYNSEHSIKRTIDSILALEYSDYEIIVVNDGSEDGTAKVMSELSKQDSRIKFYENERNMGVSYTRNHGILKSTGKYVTFIDAGDTISDNCYQFLNNDENNDAYMFELYRVEGSKEIYKELPFPDEVVNNDFIMKSIIPSMIAPLKIDNLDEPVMGAVWRLVINRDIIVDNNIKFDENIRVAEDLLFCIDILSKINSLRIIKIPYYYYVREENSSIEKYYENNFEKSIHFSKLLDERMKNLYINNYSLIDTRFQVYRFYLCTWELSAIARSGHGYKEKINHVYKVKRFFKINKFSKDIFKELNNLRKLAFIFFKLNSSTLLLTCFTLKENRRIKKYKQ